MPHEEMTSPEVRIHRAVLRGEPGRSCFAQHEHRLSPEEVAQVLSKLNEIGGIHVMDGALTCYPLLSRRIVKPTKVS